MSYYYSSYADYNSGDSLVKRTYREVPSHSHRSTQYIVNDGTLIIDDKSLRNNSSVIYNRPGSTMWVQPTTESHRSTSASDPYRRSHSLHTCRGCSWRRELSGGYCRDCIDAKLSRPRIVEVVRSDRRVLGGPERRLIEYR
ncbi:hypothetical protein AB5N19_12044 [Seiridium cardinale]